jgi:hypothetical protein
MIIWNGKAYLPEKHFPWTIQRSYDWNCRRAFLYLEQMKKLQRKNYYPYSEENKKIVIEINILVDKECQ